MTADGALQRKVACVELGDAFGDVRELFFRDPNLFRAGELHSHLSFWERIAERNPSTTKTEVLGWVLSGWEVWLGSSSKKLFTNNMSCKSFANFVRKTLLNHLTAEAISLLGKVGDVQAPHSVLPLTVEPSKPRLCHDARYLNLWMWDKPFTLDRLNDLPQYVAKDLY